MLCSSCSHQSGVPLQPQLTQLFELQSLIYYRRPSGVRCAYRPIAVLSAAIMTAALSACRSPQVDRLPPLATSEPVAVAAEKPVVQRVSFDAEQQPAPEPLPAQAKPADRKPAVEQSPQRSILKSRRSHWKLFNCHARSLADLESMAMQRNPTLARSDARINAARGEWLQVGLRPNPRIGYDGGEIGNEGRSGMQGGILVPRNRNG